MLDIAIAYLRRVHLFSFYSGSYAPREGDVLSGLSPVGTIHLRLHNADVILAETAAKSREPVKGKECLPASDMLVQRLNESIAKAVKESQARSNTSGILIVDKITDKLVMEVEEEEPVPLQTLKNLTTWIEVLNTGCFLD
mmetsp:Transcript_46602/g.54470  ORF Transcript_46602/g.54470 Transcript_46602/m.54470 type:complete len:140 (-) Transcript_46602:728-1147(-)